MVSLAIDVIIALVCLIIITRNAFRGFIKSFMALAKTILAILLAYVLHSPLARVFNEKIFMSLSEGWIYDAFVSTHDGNGFYNLYTLFDGIPEWFTNALISSGVDKSTINAYFYSKQGAPLSVVEELSKSLGGLVSNVISVVVSIVVMFVIVEIVLIILGVLLNKVGQIPVFKFLNILLGAMIGVVFSFVISWIASTAIIWIINFGAIYNSKIFASEIISNSKVLEFFNEHNVWEWFKDIFLGK